MTPIIEGTVEPQLGDIEKRNQDNIEYNKPLNVPLDEQKADILSSLYGVKPKEDIDNNKNTQDNIEKNEIKTKIDEHPNSPLIDGFIKNGLLSTEEGNLVKNSIIKGGNIEGNLSSIDGVESEKIKQVTDSINYLSKPEAKSECLNKFNKDFSEQIDSLKQVVEGSNSGEKELIGKNKDLIELIGGNYISLENTDGIKESNNESMDRAIKTSLNQLMDGKSFKRPDSFKDMLNTVRNSELSFEERFSELKKIDSLIDTDQSRSNGKQANAFGTMKNRVEKKSLTLNEKFNEFKQLVELAIINKDQNKIKELLSESVEIKEEAENKGDVFISGDIDVLVNSLNEGKEQV